MENIPARIFIVENEEMTLGVIKEILTYKGYTIAGSASSGEEVLSKIPETPCDLILMDIDRVGNLDGTSVAHMLSWRVQIPTIYLSRHARGTFFKPANISHFCDVLMIPFSISDIVSRIETTLANHRRRSPGTVNV